MTRRNILEIKSISDLPDWHRRKLAADSRVGESIKKVRSVVKAHKSRRNYEDELCQQLTLSGLPEPQRQHQWCPGRKFRCDIFYAPNLVIELEGGVHRIKDKFDRDILKSQAAFFANIRFLRIATSQVKSGEAVELVRKALKAVGL